MWGRNQTRVEPTRKHRDGCLRRPKPGPRVRCVMFLMFVLWGVAFLGIFRHWRWVPILVLVNLAYTLIVLKTHMTDPIPLNF